MRYIIDHSIRDGEPVISLTPLAGWPDDEQPIGAMTLRRSRLAAAPTTAPRSTAMKLPANATVHVTVAFVNANGNPAQVDGAVTWESSDTDVATVMVDADTMGAKIMAGPSPGTSVITASGDADLGQGVTPVSAEVEVIVIARGEAIGGEIVPDVVSGPTPGVPGGGIDNSLPGIERPVDPDHGVDVGGRPDQTLPGTPEPK